MYSILTHAFPTINHQYSLLSRILLHYAISWVHWTSSSIRGPLFQYVHYYYNWRRGMEIPAIEPLNLHGSYSEIQEWIERFEVWCSIRKGGM